MGGSVKKGGRVKGGVNKNEKEEIEFNMSLFPSNQALNLYLNY